MLKLKLLLNNKRKLLKILMMKMNPLKKLFKLLKNLNKKSLLTFLLNKPPKLLNHKPKIIIMEINKLMKSLSRDYPLMLMNKLSENSSKLSEKSIVLTYLKILMEDLKVLHLLDLNKKLAKKLLLKKLMELNIWEDKYLLKPLLLEDKDLPELKVELNNKDKSLMTLQPSLSEIWVSILMNTLYITTSLNVEPLFLPELPREKTEEAEDSDMLNSLEKKKSKKPFN